MHSSTVTASTRASGSRAGDMVGGPQRADRGIAAHEADQGALDIVEAEPAGDDLVDPGRDEAGAARDDEMGDAVERDLLAQPLDRAQRQLRRLFGIALHPRRGRRHRLVIEAARLVVRAAARRRLKHRPAMVDPGALGHAHEQFAQPRILDLALGPVDEEPVHVMLGNDAGDGVDIGAALGHLRLLPVGGMILCRRKVRARPAAR